MAKFNSIFGINILKYHLRKSNPLMQTRCHSSMRPVYYGNYNNMVLNNQFVKLNSVSLQFLDSRRNMSIRNSRYLKLKRKMLEKLVKDDKKKVNRVNLMKYAPSGLQPYMYLSRIDKPIGTWLVYIPGAMSICLAANPGCLPNFYYLGLFGVGAFLMRSAGCIINDMWDRDFDKQVERTKTRPLSSGALSMKQATASLAVHLTLALSLLLTLNKTCIMIGVASMIPVILYPLAKRVTNFPQVVLGFTINAGALMGYTAVTGTVHWPVVLPLYLASCIWTLYYDTIYALQDIEDDKTAGVKSLPLYLTKRHDTYMNRPLHISSRLSTKSDSIIVVRKFLFYTTYCYGLMMLGIAYNSTMSFPYHFSVIITCAYMCEAIARENSFEDSNYYKEVFNDCKRFGLIILLGIILGKIFVMGEQPPPIAQ